MQLIFIKNYQKIQKISIMIFQILNMNYNQIQLEPDGEDK